MGRKLKCTVEEKVAAVEDYLNGTRSVSEIMADLSIKSTRTIRDWILAYQNGGIEALCPVAANHCKNISRIRAWNYPCPEWDIA